MSLRRGRRTARLLSGAFLGMLAFCLISIAAMAQDDATPKVDIFAGYQWLHPGGTVPGGEEPRYIRLHGDPVAQQNARRRATGNRYENSTFATISIAVSIS